MLGATATAAAAALVFIPKAALAAAGTDSVPADAENESAKSLETLPCAFDEVAGSVDEANLPPAETCAGKDDARVTTVGTGVTTDGAVVTGFVTTGVCASTCAALVLVTLETLEAGALTTSGLLLTNEEREALDDRPISFTGARVGPAVALAVVAAAAATEDGATTAGKAARST